MQSVSRFSRQLDQPKGGYLKEHNEYQILNPDKDTITIDEETLKPIIIGKTVNYLARYLFFKNQPAQTILQSVFLGAKRYYQETKETDVLDFIEKIKLGSREISLDMIDDFVIAACLSNYYQMPCEYTEYRMKYIPRPCESDYNHILRMVERTLNFLKIVKDHSNFLLANYAVASDMKFRLWDNGDFRTDKAIVDLKFYSKNAWNRYNSAKLAIDYILGRYGIDVSQGEQWKNVDTLAIFDVRHNMIEYINVDNYMNEIHEILQTVQKQVNIQLIATNTR